MLCCAKYDYINYKGSIMKKRYIPPDIEIVYFETADVIKSSENHSLLHRILKKIKNFPTSCREKCK